MNVNDENLNINNINTYRQDDRYKEYLENMTGAINRALSRFATYKILPTKTVDVKPSQGKTVKQFLRFELNKIIPEFGSLERIIHIYERVLPNIDYQTVSDGVILIPYSSSYVFKGETEELPSNPVAGDAYYVDDTTQYYTGTSWETVEDEELFCFEYTPKTQLITKETDNLMELNVPEEMARMIPYFVKADLYELDEPELSATARNIFESALTEYVSFGMARKQRQQYVRNIMW